MHNQFIKNKSQILIWLSLAFVVLLADQLTKQWIVAQYSYSVSDSITAFFNLVHVHNYGAAFSFLSDQGGWQRYFFIAASLIIIFILFVLLIKTENYNKTSLILIISGALGNLYDRISYGYVIDFIELHYDNFYWPIFNFADITISIGTVILLINIIFEKK